MFRDGEFWMVESSHPNYAPLLEELRKPEAERDLSRIESLAELPKFIADIAVGRAAIRDDQIYFDGQPLGGYMADRFLEMAATGTEMTSFLMFMDNLMDNPHDGVRQDLYKWMETGKLPITPDGCLIGFKKVRADFMDVHTGRFDNSPGSVLSMPRDKCDPSRSNHCSTGFHFCSPGYLSVFGGARVVSVKINPRDVTAIPNDYNSQKGRCCQYVVVGELKSQSAATHEVWNKNVVNLEDPAELPDVMLPRDLQRKKTTTSKGEPRKRALGVDPKTLKPPASRTKGAAPRDDLAGKTAAPKEKAMAKTKTAAKSAAKKTPAKKAATKTAAPKKATAAKAPAKSAASKPARKAAAPKSAAKVATQAKARAAKAPTVAKTVRKAVKTVRKTVESAVEAVTAAVAPAPAKPKRSRAKK